MSTEINVRSSFISTSDTDFINTTLGRMATELEEASIQKREYQSLVARSLLSHRFGSRPR